MKIPRFKLRSLLISLTVFAVILAIGANCYHVWLIESQVSQRLFRIGIYVSDNSSSPNPLYKWRIGGISLTNKMTPNAHFEKELQALTYLKRIYTSGSGISDKELKQILPVRLRINELALRDESRLSDESVKTIAKCENLQFLGVNNVSITDDWLAKLVGLKRLRNLGLVHTRMSPQGLRHLAKMPSLSNLHLGGMTIDDNWLAELAKMKKLKYLRLYEEKITDEQIVELRKSLPDCEVVVSYRGAKNTDP